MRPIDRRVEIFGKLAASGATLRELVIAAKDTGLDTDYLGGTYRENLELPAPIGTTRA
ncbi:hypothetical protein ACTWPB_12115 [Nocardia sp. IBHARD005]|uniref:hypothetical protein n=1 Tax=Nocardia sp. IBHARD005 TaxID=3457765 RepID=UPI004059DC6F